MPLMSTHHESLGFLLNDATRHLRKRFEQLGSAYGLSAAQWRLLVTVKHGEGVPQARLAEILEVEPISVSRLADRMEEAGWIERRTDPADRRVRTIHGTAKSTKLFETLKSVAAEVYDEAFAGMSAAERKAVMSGLKTIIANLSASVAAHSEPESLAS